MIDYPLLVKFREASRRARKLTDSDVRVIRACRRDGVKRDILAEIFQVSRNTIYRAASGAHYADVEGDTFIEDQAGHTTKPRQDWMLECAHRGIPWEIARRGLQ